MMDTFGSRGAFEVAGDTYKIARLKALESKGHDLARLPFVLKILLENLLRFEDGTTVPAADIEALLAWDPKAEPTIEIAFLPGRVLMQDFNRGRKCGCGFWWHTQYLGQHIFS